MRLKLFFTLIIFYVIAAFGWLTYSLVNFSNNEYKLKNQVLKAGRQACILDVIEKAKNDVFLSDYSKPYQLKQITLELDTNQFNQYLKKDYFDSYQARYTVADSVNRIEIQISDSKSQLIKEQLTNKIRLHVFQSLLLTLLVGLGIYGVYYSVSAIYRLNKLQNNFLLSVTHEFKTPIAAIKLMMQTLGRREFDREKQLELIEKTVENADRLNELSENMLTAMQIENKRYEYSSEQFSFSDLMYTIAEQHGMKGPIETDIEENVNYIGDQFALRISISNLVQNAFKYSDFQKINLVLMHRNNNVVIQVKDNGIGIPDSEKKKIFKKFYRVQDEEIRTTKGTGLGLFIAQQSIKKHRGKIAVKDNKPSGTIFEIILPGIRNA
jgi:signal transduction histidine kinase